LALAVFFLQSGQVLLACGIVPEKEHRRFREGPLEIGIAPLGPCCPVAFASRFFGTLDEAAIGDEILPAGETLDVVDLIQQDEAQDFPDAGHRLEPIQGIGVVLLRRFDNVQLEIVEQRVLVPNQRQVHFRALLPGGSREPLGDPVAVGFVGQLFPNRGQVIRAVGVLDVR
jgi:hypothetical protein